MGRRLYTPTSRTLTMRATQLQVDEGAPAPPPLEDAMW
jgi:hypothetical protein